MPAYPCAKCNTPVDARDLTCRSCGDKAPFTCSKCNKRLGAMQIFEADKLTFQKPIFCKACGTEVSPKTCPKCETDVYKATGVDDGGVFYHPDCFKTVALQRKITPILQIGLALFLGYALFSQFWYYMTPQLGSNGALFIGFCAGVSGAGLGWFLGGLMAPRRPSLIRTEEE